MTNEEAIAIIKSECYVMDLLDLDWTQMINKALDMAIKALEQTELNSSYNSIKTELEQTRWIPVSERLPENRGYYATTVKIEIHDLKPYYEIRIAQFDGRDFDIGYIGDGFSVIAWQPLPTPYKESKEE